MIDNTGSIISMGCHGQTGLLLRENSTPARPHRRHRENFPSPRGLIKGFFLDGRRAPRDTHHRRYERLKRAIDSARTRIRTRGGDPGQAGRLALAFLESRTLKTARERTAAWEQILSRLNMLGTAEEKTETKPNPGGTPAISKPRSRLPVVPM